jgi:tryptophanyl-tRNA synthetase
VFQYDQYFFLPDDRALAELKQKCRSGAILCGDCKAALAERIIEFIQKHQERREKAKDVVEDFMLRD